MMAFEGFFLLLRESRLFEFDVSKSSEQEICSRRQAKRLAPSPSQADAQACLPSLSNSIFLLPASVFCLFFVRRVPTGLLHYGQQLLLSFALLLLLLALLLLAAPTPPLFR